MATSGLRLFLLLLAVTLGGCSAAVRDALQPDFLNGKDTAERIDREIGDMLAARYPAIPVGRTTCPLLLNVTGRRIDQCTLPVGFSSMRIGVSRDGEYGMTRIDELDALVVASDAERSAAEAISRDYGEEHADVRCERPEVRVVPLPAEIACTVARGDARVVLPVRAYISGHGTTFSVSWDNGADTRYVKTFGVDVTSRKEGTVSLPGALVEGYLRATAGGREHGEIVRRGLLGPARCPPHVVVVDSAPVTCTVLLGGSPLPCTIRFDAGRGMVIDCDKTVVIMPLVRELAARYYERRAGGGAPAKVVVECEKEQVAIVDPGTSIPCVGRNRGIAFPFQITVTDSDGGVSIETFDRDDDSPST